jgi:hypothetical protein
MARIRFVSLVLLLLAFALPALAQDAPVGEGLSDVQIAGLISLLVHFASSLANTFLSSTSLVGRIINVLALGIGKAKPDPSAQ